MHNEQPFMIASIIAYDALSLPTEEVLLKHFAGEKHLQMSQISRTN